MTDPLYTIDRRDLELRLAFCRAFAAEVPEAFDDLQGRSEEELTKWAHRWHIGVPWIVEHAKRMLEIEERYSDVSLPVLWMTGGGVKIPVPEPIELVIRWDPSLPGGTVMPGRPKPTEDMLRIDEQVPIAASEPTRTERLHVTVGGASRKNAWRALRDAWKIYASQVDLRYRGVGFETRKERTGGENIPIHDRMCWLVWRVVQNLSWTKISKQAGTPRTTAQTAVTKVGRALDLIAPAE